jgi:hypothetical protein
MLDIVLLNNEEWHLSIGFLGLGPLRVIDSAGHMVVSTRQEKNFLQDLSRCLIKQKLEPNEFNSVKRNMFSDLSSAIHQRAVDGHQSFLYRVVFNGDSETSVKNYILANRLHGQK